MNRIARVDNSCRPVEKYERFAIFEKALSHPGVDLVLKGHTFTFTAKTLNVFLMYVNVAVILTFDMIMTKFPPALTCQVMCHESFYPFIGTAGWHVGILEQVPWSN